MKNKELDLLNVETVESDVEAYENKKTKRKEVHRRMGNYIFNKELGKGAFSTVYKCNLPSKILGFDSSGNKFAIKQIPKVKMRMRYIEGLSREIKLMQSINSENVIKLFDVKQSENNYYLIMEYCSGGDLERFRGKKISESGVQSIIYQVSAALKTLLEKNIMHRDLKLSNLLLSSKESDAVIKLADFGLARELREDELANTCCGTPLYMAPEILLRQSYNTKADLWSVGVIIYLFLTGKFPFIASSPQKLLLAISNGIVKFPKDLVISECCYELLKNLLQIDPKLRMDWEVYFEHPFIKTDPKVYGVASSNYNYINFINASIVFIN